MELQIFQNAEFGSVRSTMLKEEPYFVGKDVAEILGYADPNKAIAMHVDEDDKLNDKTASSLGQRGGWFINESGLYSLILSSKLPAAKRFKRWVTSEALPAIRRHGLYAVDDMLNNPDALIEALQAYKAERMQRLALEAENAVQKQQLIEMQPKASYYDVVLNSPDLVSITEISKDYGWSAQKMNEYLHRQGIQFKQVEESGSFIGSMRKKVILAPRHILILPQTEAFIPRFIPTGLRRADFSFMTY